MTTQEQGLSREQIEAACDEYIADMRAHKDPGGIVTGDGFYEFEIMAVHEMKRRLLALRTLSAPVAQSADSDMILVSRTMLQKIARGPLLPLPDPEAHSWRAYGERAATAMMDGMRIARELLSGLTFPKQRIEPKQDAEFNASVHEPGYTDTAFVRKPITLMQPIALPAQSADGLAGRLEALREQGMTLGNMAKLAEALPEILRALPSASTDAGEQDRTNAVTSAANAGFRHGIEAGKAISADVVAGEVRVPGYSDTAFVRHETTWMPKPFGWHVVNKDGEPARNGFSYEYSADLVTCADADWPANAPHRSVALTATPAAAKEGA